MEKKQGWKRLQKLSFDKKRLSQRALKAEVVTRKHANKFVVKRLRSLRDARQHIASWLFIVGAIIGLVALQMTLYQTGYKTLAATSGGTYGEAINGSIDTLNPLFATTNAEQSASYLIFSRLFDYDSTGHLRNDIARDVRLDETQKIYTITLRDDVKWHDGAKLTADDVVYTVDTMKNPEVRAVMRNNWHEVAVKKVNTHVVQFTLPAPYATFRHALTFSILPKHILAQVQPSALRENTFSVSPVGSGPFKIRLLQTIPGRDSQKIAHLNAWTDYYQGAPKLARFELHAYDKPESLVQALKVGDVNAAAGIPLKSDLPKQFVVNDIPLGSGVYAIFNTTSPQLTDVTIRQAIQKATDTRLLRKNIGVPELPLDLPFIPHQIEATALPQKPTIKMQEANALLEAAGWKLSGKVRTKDGKPLELKIAAIKDERYKVVIDELVRQWKQLGITTKVDLFDTTTNQQSFAQAVLQPRMYDVLVNELVIGGDADVYAYWHSSQAQALGYNFANYQNGISDDTLSSARVRNDPTLRARKYTAFAQQWISDAPAIGLFQSSMRYAHTKAAQGTSTKETLPTAVDRYTDILYWTAERGHVYKTP
jgi:peptide/nickel transport system substrate-binding protein